jgi:hypothetical protein
MPPAQDRAPGQLSGMAHWKNSRLMTTRKPCTHKNPKTLKLYNRKTLETLYPAQDRTSDQLSGMAQWKNSRLMTFDSQNAHVKTHFNDQLVVLLREVTGRGVGADKWGGHGGKLSGQGAAIEREWSDIGRK